MRDDHIMAGVAPLCPSLEWLGDVDGDVPSLFHVDTLPYIQIMRHSISDLDTTWLRCELT